MGSQQRWLRRGVRGTVMCAVAISAAVLGPVAAATSSAQTGPVSPAPAANTPALVTTSTPEQVRQLVECGGTMYAVGSFTQISGSNGNFARNNIFSFSAAAPYPVNSWNPDVNGTVDSIALSSDCTRAYIGGKFTMVGSTAVKNIAEIDTSTGAVVPGFGHTAGSEVDTLLLVNGRLLAGGQFKSINGSTADPYYASLNPVTGKNDGYLNLNISGHYVYKGVITNTT